MIVFDLKCASGHRFEGWFQSSAAYEAQQQGGELICPVCGDAEVTKAPMAPKLGGRASVPAPTSSKDMESGMAAASAHLPDTLASELRQVMDKVRTHVEQSCDYVGERFADEARAMHYGEREERGIYGQASAQEAADLVDEGIDILPLPATPKADA